MLFSMFEIWFLKCLELSYRVLLAWFTFSPLFQPIKLILRKQGINQSNERPKANFGYFHICRKATKIIESESKTKEVQPIFVWKFPKKWHLKRLSFGTTCNKLPFDLTLELNEHFSPSFPSQWYREPQDRWV